MESTLFTVLSTNEEASLSGGKKTLVIKNNNVAAIVSGLNLIGQTGNTALNDGKNGGANATGKTNNSVDTGSNKVDQK